MTAALASVDADHSHLANAWIQQRHTELLGRARACFAYCNPQHRDEAVAEILAASLAAAHIAALRGKLDRITPYWCVVFAARQFRGGRRFAGTSSVCVMSEATRLCRGVRVVSFDQDVVAAQRIVTRRILCLIMALQAIGQDGGDARRWRYDAPFCAP